MGYCGAVQQSPFATVMLNGAQVIRCKLPTDASKESVTVEATSELKQMLAANAMHLQCVLLSPNLTPVENVEWTGVLLIDDVIELNLGAVRTVRQSVASGDWLASFPSTLTLSLERNKIDPTLHEISPAEADLIQLVKGLLEDDVLNPRRGSLPTRVVSAGAQKADCELYHRVVGPIHPDWDTFIASNDGVFNAFQYGEQEIVNRGMRDIGMIGETRVVLRPKERSRLAVAELSDGEDVEERLRAFVVALLEEEGDMESTEVLARVASDPSLLHYVSPAFSVLMRTLNKHRGCFTWTTDPGKPTIISIIDPEADAAGAAAAAASGTGAAGGVPLRVSPGAKRNRLRGADAAKDAAPVPVACADETRAGSASSSGDGSVSDSSTPPLTSAGTNPNARPFYGKTVMQVAPAAAGDGDGGGEGGSPLASSSAGTEGGADRQQQQQQWQQSQQHARGGGYYQDASPHQHQQQEAHAYPDRADGAFPRRTRVGGAGKGGAFKGGGKGGGAGGKGGGGGPPPTWAEAVDQSGGPAGAGVGGKGDRSRKLAARGRKGSKW